jgi:hypothetical protein
VSELTEKAEESDLTEILEIQEAPESIAAERTDTDMLQEILEQFSTSKDARKHIKEIATGNNKFNKTFGESSIRKCISQKCKFKGDAGKIVSHEVTAKIGAGNEMEIQPEATADPEAPTQTTEQPTQKGDGTAEKSYQGTPDTSQSYQNFGSYEAAKAELTPIQERSVKCILENVLSIAGLKGEGKDNEILTDQETKDTVTLIPYILKKAMKTDMTQDNYETLTIAMHAGNLVSKVVKKRIEKGKMFKKDNPAAKTEIPNPAAPEQNTATQTPEPPSQIATVNESAPSIDQQTEAFKKRQI